MSDKIGNKLKPNKNPKVKVFFAPFFLFFLLVLWGNGRRKKSNEIAISWRQFRVTVDEAR